MKKGFSLFELMLVMLIISVIYGFFIQKFTKATIKSSPKLDSLKEFLLSVQSNSKEKVSLICFDDCKICKIYKNHQDLNISVNFFKEQDKTVVYKLVGDRAEEIEFDDFYEDSYLQKEVCFKYSVYPNKSSDKIILDTGNKVFLYDNYFHETKEFFSVEDAKEYWRLSNMKAKG